MLAQPIVEIRRANQRDAAAIELLIRESFHEHEPAYTPEAFDLATPSASYSRGLPAATLDWRHRVIGDCVEKSLARLICLLTPRLPAR
jgi:hypothetical protein